MTDFRDGHRFRIPASRNLSWDLLSFHRQVPLCPHDRIADLSLVSRTRQNCPVRISWPALFLKAYGLVARNVPQLRQTWYRWPWAHLYQHPVSVGIVTVQRELDAEPWLFWGRIVEPESLPLTELQRRIDVFRDADVRSVFPKQLRFAKLPMLLRRSIWWWNLNVETRQRAQRMGTFFLSTLAGRGAEIALPPSVQTGCLTFGPLTDSGHSRVTLAYDHRILDGALVAECLRQLEATLNGVLAEELVSIRNSSAGIAA